MGSQGEPRDASGKGSLTISTPRAQDRSPEQARDPLPKRDRLWEPCEKPNRKRGEVSPTRFYPLRKGYCGGNVYILNNLPAVCHRPVTVINSGILSANISRMPLLCIQAICTVPHHPGLLEDSETRVKNMNQEHRDRRIWNAVSRLRLWLMLILSGS